jgi:hypothetical protein
MAEAADEAARALEMAQTIDYQSGVSGACSVLGAAGLYSRDWQTAHAWARRAQSVDSSLISGYQARNRARQLALACFAVGDLDETERVCHEGLELARRVGDRYDESFHTLMLACVAMNAGDLATAAVHVEHSLRCAASIGARLVVTDNLMTAGTICARSGRLDEAIALWTANRELPETSQAVTFEDTVFEPSELQRQIRHELAPDRLRSAERRGRTMSFDAAVELARSQMATIAEGHPRDEQPISGTAPLSRRERGS